MAESWNCAHCREIIEPQFEYCWNCGTSYDGRRNPDFVSQQETVESQSAGIHTLPLWFHICWFLICALGVLSVAVVADTNLSESWALHLAATVFLFLSGILLGVMVNVTGQLYWIVREKYFSNDQEPETEPVPAGSRESQSESR